MATYMKLIGSNLQTVQGRSEATLFNAAEAEQILSKANLQFPNLRLGLEESGGHYRVVVETEFIEEFMG